MAHKSQMMFFEKLRQRFSEVFEKSGNILEVGSQNINGTVRDYFPSSTSYLGIDLSMAKCVDWVVPGELIELPDEWADVVISTECFEHCKDWGKVFINMINSAKWSLLSSDANEPFAKQSILMLVFTLYNYYEIVAEDIAEKIY